MKKEKGETNKKTEERINIMLYNKLVSLKYHDQKSQQALRAADGTTGQLFQSYEVSAVQSIPWFPSIYNINPLFKK